MMLVLAAWLATVSPTAPGATAEVSADAAFALGIELAESGMWSEATEAFVEADRLGDSRALRARARFNAGRTLWDRAQAALGGPEADREVAAEHLRASERMFRGALDLEPEDGDAARAIELVRREARRIEREIEESRQRDERLRQLAEDLRRLAEEQEAAAEEERDEGAAARQEAMRERTREAQERLERDTAGDDDPGTERAREAADALQEAEAAQAAAGEDLEAGREEESRESQRRAAERLREAAERLADPSGEGHAGDERVPDDAEDGSEEGADGEPEQEGEGVPEPMDAEGQESEDGAEAAEAALRRDVLDHEREVREMRDELRRRLLPSRRDVERDW